MAEGRTRRWTDGFICSSAGAAQKAKLLMHWAMNILTSCMFTRHASWPKQRDPGYKWTSSDGWKDSASSIGWWAPTAGGQLKVKPLVLCVKRSQLMWIKRAPEGLPSEVFWARPTGTKPPGKTQNSFEGTFIWSDALGSPRMSWRISLGKKMSGSPS